MSRFADDDSVFDDHRTFYERMRDLMIESAVWAEEAKWASFRMYADSEILTPDDEG